MGATCCAKPAPVGSGYLLHQMALNEVVVSEQVASHPKTRFALSERYYKDAEAADVSPTEFLVNGYRLIAGGFVPQPDFASSKGQQFLNELREIRGKVPPLYFENFSLSFWGENNWKFFEDLFQDHSLDKIDFSGMAVGVRHLFITSEIKKAIASDTKQVVLLGSGLGTRSLTLHKDGVTIFDVDQRPVLAYKLKALSKSGFNVYPARVVMGDYFKMDLIAALEKVGFDVDAPTIFAWEGTQVYTSLSMTKALLGKLFKNVPKATVVFDSIAAEVDALIDPLVAGGTIMWPGRTDSLMLAESVDAKVVKSISAHNYLSETLGSSQAMNDYFPDPSRAQLFAKQLGRLMKLNVFAKQ